MENKKFKEIILMILTFIFIGIVTYTFLSLCNWDLSLKNWNGFSRFILGLEGIIFFVVTMSEF